MRILFAGTPAIAVPSLEALARTHDVRAVLTGVDQPSGRGRRPEPTPVKESAAELGLPVIEAARIDAGVLEKVRALSAEVLVVVAFGKIFRKSFLEIFPRGGINLHPSLLPRHRGPSPMTAAILAGDTETGVSIQRLALKFDSGDVLTQKRIPLRGDETTGSLTDELAPLGAQMLEWVLSRMQADDIRGVPQHEDEATYCHLVKKEEGRIAWTEEAALIERKVRAYDPWPRASTSWDGRSLLILKSKLHTDTLPPNHRALPGTVVGSSPTEGILVMTGKGILAIQRLQLEFKNPTDWRPFLNGHPAMIGSRLGTGLGG